MVVSKSALAWGKRLDRFDRMDSTLAQFCRQEGVSQIAFYYWRRKLRGQPAASQRDQDSPLPHFLPVSLSPLNKFGREWSQYDGGIAQNLVGTWSEPSRCHPRLTARVSGLGGISRASRTDCSMNIEKSQRRFAG